MQEARVKEQDTVNFIEDESQDWLMTDDAVQELIGDVWPEDIDPVILGSMVEEMREFMITQFELNGVATRDQLLVYNENFFDEDKEEYEDDEKFINGLF